MNIYTYRSIYGMHLASWSGLVGVLHREIFIESTEWGWRSSNQLTSLCAYFGEERWELEKCIALSKSSGRLHTYSDHSWSISQMRLPIQLPSRVVDKSLHTWTQSRCLWRAGKCCYGESRSETTASSSLTYGQMLAETKRSVLVPISRTTTAAAAASSTSAVDVRTIVNLKLRPMMAIWNSSSWPNYWPIIIELADWNRDDDFNCFRLDFVWIYKFANCAQIFNGPRSNANDRLLAIKCAGRFSTLFLLYDQPKLLIDWQLMWDEKTFSSVIMTSTFHILLHGSGFWSSVCSNCDSQNIPWCEGRAVFGLNKLAARSCWHQFPAD